MGLLAKRLVKPVINEVSGVDHPAHLSAGWLVMKAAGDPNPDMDEIIKAFGDDPDYLDDDEGDDEVADEALTKQVADLTATVEALTKARADEQTAFAVEKAHRTALEEAVVKAGGTVPQVDPSLVTAATEEAAFTKAIGTLPAEAQAVMKAQRDEVRKAREEARTEREARVGREYLDVAKSQFAGVGNPEQIGTVLRQIDAGLPADTATEVKRLMKAAGEQQRFAALGGHGQSSPGDGSAWAAVVQKAEELVKAQPTLTMPQALTKAREANPDLAARYIAEMQGRG